MTKEQSLDKFFASWKERSELVAVFILDEDSISQIIRNVLILDCVLLVFKRKMCEILILQMGSPEAEMFQHIYMYAVSPVMYIIGKKGIPVVIDDFEMKDCNINDVSRHILTKLETIAVNGQQLNSSNQEAHMNLNVHNERSLVIKFTVPEGDSFTLTFLPAETLHYVVERLILQRGLENFTLMRGYPRVPFQDEEFNMTLEELGFFPSGIIFIHNHSQRDSTIIERSKALTTVFWAISTQVIDFFRDAFNSVFRLFGSRPSQSQGETQNQGRSQRLRHSSNVHTLHDNDDTTNDGSDQNKYNGNSTQYHF